MTDPTRPPVVVITGASSGIGRATALAYAAEGADLVLAARGPVGLDEVAIACRRAGAGSAAAVPTDVTDAEAVSALFDEAVLRFGRVDVVVHAAMVMAYGTIEELPLDVFERVVATGLHGTANVARSALPQFRRQHEGALVIVTSLLASVAVPGIGAYVAAKWGQLGLARVLQLEVRDEPGVRVATVSPGAVATPIYDRAANVGGRPGTPPPPVDRPERVAARILRAADGGPIRRTVGPLNQFVVFGARFATPLYDRLVGPLYDRFALRREQVAPTPGNVFTSSDPVEAPTPVDVTAG